MRPVLRFILALAAMLMPWRLAFAETAIPEGETLIAFAQEDPVAAEQLLTEALEEARANNPEFATQTHLFWLDALGLALASQQKWLEADAAFVEFGQQWARRDDITAEELEGIRQSVLQIRRTIARKLFDNGDFAKSEPIWVALAADGRERVLSGDADGMYPILKLATTLAMLGREDESEALLRRAIELSDSSLGSDSPTSIVTLYNLAQVIFRRDRREESLPLFREATALSEMALGRDHEITLMVRRGLAINLTGLQRAEEAEPALREVLASQERVLGPDHLDTLRTANDLALSLIELGRSEEALEILNRIEPQFVAKLGENHPDLFMLRQNRAGVLRFLERDFAVALEEARKAVSGLRAQRNRFASDGRAASESRRLTPIERTHYHLLIETAYNARALADADQIALFEEAIQAAQEVMDSPASAAVARRTARALARREGSDILRRFEAIEALSQRYAELIPRRNALLTANVDGRATALATLESQLDAIDTELTQQAASLAQDFPVYADLANAPPLDFAALRDLVTDTDDAVLLVLPTYLGTHFFAFSDSGISWGRSDLTDKGINALVRRLLWDVGASIDVSAAEDAQWSSEGEGAYPFDRDSAHRLYSELVAPVAHRIAGARHLYVVGGGSLASLPFGMLVTEEPRGSDGDPNALRDTKWLADAYALIQLPSLQSLQFQRRYATEATSGESFIGFGDPVLAGRAATRGGGDTVRGSSNVGGASIAQAYSGGSDEHVRTDVEALRKMARLPGTARELEQLRSVLGAPEESVLTAEEATETNVKRAALRDAAVVAFATHGLLAGEVDGATEPGLVFTPPSRATPLDDGLLTMSEIAELDLNAQWVILSACNTAAGDGTSGAEGLSGLAKAFFFAGAQSLLASHWPVRDDVAAQLTVSTIANHKGGMSRAEALQAAMRSIRNDTSADSASDTWAHPNAWAAFTLIGDSRDAAIAQ